MKLQIQISEAAFAHVCALSHTGLYGPDPEDVAQALLMDELRAAYGRGLVPRAEDQSTNLQEMMEGVG